MRTPPLGVAVIDASIELFGCIFYQLSDNHQNQLLTHFRECIKQAKPFNRQQAIQINIITGFLAGLKVIVMILLLLLSIISLFEGYCW